MNEEKLNVFKQQIYVPYTEAWTIMKFMRDTEPKDDSYWDICIQKCEDFSHKYPSAIGKHILQVMLSTLDIIGNLERG